MNDKEKLEILIEVVQELQEKLNDAIAIVDQLK